MSEEEAERWEEIKRTFGRNQYLQGGDQNDPVSRVVSQLPLQRRARVDSGHAQGRTFSYSTTTIDTSALSADLENLRQTLAENIANAQSQEAKVRRLGFINQMEAISGPLRNTWSNQSGVRNGGRESADVGRTPTGHDGIHPADNQQLAQTITQSQASAQAAQLQTALQQVGTLFGNYQESH